MADQRILSSEEMVGASHPTKADTLNRLALIDHGNDGQHALAGFQGSQYAADAQASDTYVITLDPVPAAYFTGMMIVFKANTVNTGACTLNVNGLGAKAIKKQGNVDPSNGDIKAAQFVVVIYDGTNFQLVNALSALTQTVEAAGFTIAGGTTSKTLTVSSDADTKDIIKGDGTAGRVLRVLQIGINNGTDPTTIKAQSWNIWNGDANAIEDNLGKGGDTGVFALSADGSTLTLQDAGISGNTVAVISCWVNYNLIGTPLMVNPTFAGGIIMECFNSTTGVAVDLTTLVDAGAGTIYIYVSYLTSA